MDKNRKIYYSSISDLRSVSGIKSNQKVSKKAYLLEFLKYVAVFVAVPIFLSGIYYLKNIYVGSFDVSDFIANLSKDKIDMPVFFDEAQGKIIADSGAVLGESDSQNTAVASSENFKAKQINIGGESAVAEISGGAIADNSVLEIYDIKSESFIDKKSQSLSGTIQNEENSEVKLLVSWKTNKLALSQLTYSKSDGGDPKSIKEQGYGFNHTAVIPELEPRTSYTYSIKTRDQAGNEKISDYFGIYTPSIPTSVFNLITNAMDDVFGWAVSKN